ncbi:MAG: NAD(P)/FAD-dependent oxidoreductase [Acidimicrobiales bacterium]
MTSANVVIVGASLAGLHAAAALRRAGDESAITVVGAEVHLPYDRPPLSKQLLTGRVEAEQIRLPIEADLGIEWRLGVAATRLDAERRRVGLGGVRDELPFDRLVLATGARPRWLPGLAPGEGVHVLRSLDDALTLRAALQRNPRVAVIGAGFIGLEVAASCRARGLAVTVIEALPIPLERAIGAAWGARVAKLHRDHGTQLRLGALVAGLVGAGTVEGVRLADGEVVPADVVVVGVGVAPETSWLEGSGVELDDGVICDDRLRVRVGGRVRPDIVAAGDVARWYHRGYRERVRVEHWTNAVEQGEAAATTLLHGEEAPPFAPVPYFWSDQYATKLQFVGRTLPGDETQVVDGSPEDARWAAAYGRAGRLVAGLGFARPAKVMAMRRLIEEGAAFPPSI